MRRMVEEPPSSGWARVAPPLARDRPVAVEIDLWSTAMEFRRGHRLKLVIGSANAPRTQPHTNQPPDAPAEAPPVVANNFLYLGETPPRGAKGDGGADGGDGGGDDVEAAGRGGSAMAARDVSALYLPVVGSGGHPLFAAR